MGRPELSEAVASFDNLPVEFQLFVNIDITDVFLADPDLITGFALSASEDTTGQIKFKEQRDPSGKTTRLVLQCRKYFLINIFNILFSIFSILIDPNPQLDYTWTESKK